MTGTRDVQKNGRPKKTLSWGVRCKRPGKYQGDGVW